MVVNKKKMAKKQRNVSAVAGDFPTGSRDQWKLLGEVIRRMES